MKRSRDGSRSRKNRIKENRTRCRETEQNPSLLHREIFLFPEGSKASAMQMRSRSRRPPFHGDWGKYPNKQKRLGSTQTLLAK